MRLLLTFVLCFTALGTPSSRWEESPMTPLSKELNKELQSLNKELNILHAETLKKRLAYEEQLQSLEKRLKQTQEKKQTAQILFDKTAKETADLLRNFSLEREALNNYQHKFQDKRIDAEKLKLGQKLFREQSFVLHEKTGQSVEGELFHIGHFAATFLSKDQKQTAWLNPQKDSLKYVEDTTTPENILALKQLSQGQAANTSIDLTGSNAFKLKQNSRDWIAELKAGGTTVVPLLLLGLICIIIGLIKALQLYLTPNKFKHNFEALLPLIKESKLTEAQEKISQTKGPAKAILQECLTHHEASKEELEELISESIMQLYGKLNKLLSIISLSAATAPLLGLLGTVMGIIATFDLLAVFGTGDASRLSSGISEALITTKLGLIVAVPCLIIYSILSRRVKSIIFNLEHASLTFVNNLKIRK